MLCEHKIDAPETPLSTPEGDPAMQLERCLELPDVDAVAFRCRGRIAARYSHTRTRRIVSTEALIGACGTPIRYSLGPVLLASAARSYRARIRLQPERNAAPMGSRRPTVFVMMTKRASSYPCFMVPLGDCATIPHVAAELNGGRAPMPFPWAIRRRRSRIRFRVNGGAVCWYC